jgi:hypothetical protein
MHEIKKGQRWMEVDPRFRRIVEVLEVREGDIKSVLIASVDPATNNVGRKNWASKSRFNGKRGNYALIKP